jgi:signal transduction histidine kinase
MNKALKFLKVIFIVLYLVLVFFLFIKKNQITSFYKLPAWIIPGIFFVSIIYICYQYIVFVIKKDKTETEMISIINHTFRTPLTGILWHVNELEKNISQNEKLLYLQNVSSSTNKILDILDILIGIKNVKNTSSYYFEAVSIREIIEKSIKKYREYINKKNITFQFSLTKDLPLLTVDLKRISFVVDAVIENAISYTKKDGKILVDCIANPQKLTLYVSDTGIGLGLVDKMRIFSKFYRSRQAKLMNTDGMGLKLYLSKQIVKRHGGKIYAKSNGLNEGATFFIELPFKK